MNWLEALKIYNAQMNNTGKFIIPKKGSPEYDQVKKLMTMKEGNGLFNNKPTTRNEVDVGVFLSNGAKDYLLLNWNKKVKQIAVGVSPVGGVIQSLLNTFTRGELQKKLESMNITNLVHPHVVFIYKNSNMPNIRYERNKRIDMDNQIKKHPETKWLLPYINVNETLGNLIRTHQNYYGGSFDKIIRYDPRNQNSQNFIEDFLKANNLNTKTINDFYRQDTNEIMKNFDSTNELVKKIVLFGLTISNIMGDGIK
jgi:hypothetical protein